MIKKDYTQRAKKKVRIRKKIFGTAECPRLAVFRSLNHIYGQLIDDTTGNTLAAASSKSKGIADAVAKAKNKTDKSAIVGELLAKKALEKEIKSVVFDRGGFRYHGRIKAFADSARKAGLKF